MANNSKKFTQFHWFLYWHYVCAKHMRIDQPEDGAMTSIWAQLSLLVGGIIYSLGGLILRVGSIQHTHIFEIAVILGVVSVVIAYFAARESLGSPQKILAMATEMDREPEKKYLWTMIVYPATAICSFVLGAYLLAARL